MSVLIHLNHDPPFYLSKSVSLVFSKSPTVVKCKTVVNGKFLEQVESFIYLGETLIGWKRRKVISIVVILEYTFNSMKDVPTPRRSTLQVKLRVLK